MIFFPPFDPLAAASRFSDAFSGPLKLTVPRLGKARRQRIRVTVHFRTCPFPDMSISEWVTAEALLGVIALEMLRSSRSPGLRSKRNCHAINIAMCYTFYVWSLRILTTRSAKSDVAERQPAVCCDALTGWQTAHAAPVEGAQRPMSWRRVGRARSIVSARPVNDTKGWRLFGGTNNPRPSIGNLCNYK